MGFAPFWKSWGSPGTLGDQGFITCLFSQLPSAASVPVGTVFITTDNGMVQSNGVAWKQVLTSGYSLLQGDQIATSQDTSPFREGSNSILVSGQLYTLVGDLVMKYWSHNVGLDANGNFLARDDAGPCAIMTFSEGIGTNAPIYSMYSCPTGIAGSAPGTFTKQYSIDLTNGLVTFNNAVMYTGTTALTNGAAAQTATLTNGPTAGNPTKWIPINDNGTTRYIPAW